MKEQLERRLRDLKAELESGQKMLAELETRQANIKNTLLRISGAIQVLEEEPAKTERPDKYDAEASFDINSTSIQETNRIDASIEKKIQSHEL